MSINSLSTLTACILLIYHKETFRHQIPDKENIKLWISIIIILTIYSFLAFILSTVLIILHIWLNIKGLSTFEYAITRRLRKATKVINGNETVSRENDISFKLENNSKEITNSLSE